MSNKYIELAQQLENIFDYWFDNTIYLTIYEPLEDYWVIELSNKISSNNLFIPLGNKDVMSHVKNMGIWVTESKLSIDCWNRAAKEIISVMYKFLMED